MPTAAALPTPNGDGAWARAVAAANDRAAAAAPPQFVRQGHRIRSLPFHDARDASCVAATAHQKFQEVKRAYESLLRDEKTARASGRLYTWTRTTQAHDDKMRKRRPKISAWAAVNQVKKDYEFAAERAGFEQWAEDEPRHARPKLPRDSSYEWKVFAAVMAVSR
eukprot:gene53176-232_t